MIAVAAATSAKVSFADSNVIWLTVTMTATCNNTSAFTCGLNSRTAGSLTTHPPYCCFLTELRCNARRALRTPPTIYSLHRMASAGCSQAARQHRQVHHTGSYYHPSSATTRWLVLPGRSSRADYHPCSRASFQHGLSELGSTSLPQGCSADRLWEAKSFSNSVTCPERRAKSERASSRTVSASLIFP